MENLHKINEQYEKDFVDKKENEKDIDVNLYNVDSFLINHRTDEQESLKNIIHEDKKKKLKQLFWMYEQEYRQNQKLQELNQYNEEFMKLPLTVKLVSFSFFYNILI